MRRDIKSDYSFSLTCRQRAGTAMAMIIALVLIMPGPAYADERKDESYHQDYIYGAPAQPTDAWIMSRGGRLYDNWFSSLDADEPEGTHPAWPASNTRTGAVTWRCKSCHGWDYKGADGKYGSGSYKTGIGGVMPSAGKSMEAIKARIMDATHGFTTEMIPDEEMGYLAAFVSGGLDDMNAVIDSESGNVKGGDSAHGAAIFQTTCAACHGFDGRALDWGDDKEHGYVGTEANGNPWETLHKIRNGHPGVEMISLRALPMQDAVDLLAYTRTLPAE